MYLNLSYHCLKVSVYKIQTELITASSKNKPNKSLRAGIPGSGNKWVITPDSAQSNSDSVPPWAWGQQVRGTWLYLLRGLIYLCACMYMSRMCWSKRSQEGSRFPALEPEVVWVAWESSWEHSRPWGTEARALTSWLSLWPPNSNSGPKF